MSLVVDLHRQYLADAARVEKFRAALSALVKPGDVVLDLASGTGILGFLACQAGALRVYAIEADAIIGLARQIARDNGLAERVICVQAHSMRASLPEPVDLIVTDLAGRFGFEGGLVETLGDARRRFLKPGGRIIPSSATLWLAPVEAAEARAQIDFWQTPIHGLTFAAAHRIACSTGYPRHFAAGALLSEPKQLATLDLSQDIGTLSGRTEHRVGRAGTLDGVCGWFSAALAPGIELTNAPTAPDRINRRNVFFPLRESVRVQPGDRVSVSMFIRPEDMVVRWQVELQRTGETIHVTDASTFEGMLVSREEVERTRPEFQPTLTPAGRARQTVLDLCDGVRTLGDIEGEVFERHAPLFRSRADAAVFVSEVVARYTT